MKSWTCLPRWADGCKFARATKFTLSPDLDRNYARIALYLCSDESKESDEEETFDRIRIYSDGVKVPQFEESSKKKKNK